MRSWVRFAVVVAVLMIALPVFAMVGFSLDGGNTFIDTVTVNGCFLDIKVNHAQDGAFRVVVLDDGITMFDFNTSAGMGGTFTASYPITGPALPGAAGIAIAIYRNGSFVAGADPIFYSDDVGNACRLALQSAAAERACNARAVLPPGSVVGELPFGGRGYWAPNKITPEVVINPGRYWVVGAALDEDGDLWYMIYISCNYLWVPGEWMSPTFDGPWNGEPLPATGNLTREQQAIVNRALGR